MLAPDDPADLDNGPRSTKSGTERMCAVSRSVRPIDELIRFVVAPTGEAIPDLKRKLPGRGLWVSANRKAVTEAAKRNVFAKGFKKNVKASPTLADDTDKLMVRGVIEALAMAGKAGVIISGFTKVEDVLKRGDAQALIHASDGAADGIRKLDGTARQAAEFNENPRPLPIITVLSCDELDLALGRSNVIHAAVLTGPAGKTFLSRSQTLVQYRMADDDGNASAKASVKQDLASP
ncbi:RNA-binding protein [Tardiphaga sp.]|uniref:RNA-binding protein n=1 Tax=Tardiphaga sp. TaxID=1926292 RepID=UPI0025F421F6|nr:RNA-binding protein [Tardiphaga sp.]